MAVRLSHADMPCRGSGSGRGQEGFTAGLGAVNATRAVCGLTGDGSLPACSILAHAVEGASKLREGWDRTQGMGSEFAPSGGNTCWEDGGGGGGSQGLVRPESAVAPLGRVLNGLQAMPGGGATECQGLLLD
ncbi:hypothetical protein NDU88_006740 [Pleurodeles waltl]|uniref:Uncharacterized protein n=1 Tax=Pleurodeles waltl TaxID=8319 RepID=A0AAV7NVA5_PLEWA|nr:hypothetical protein NDU88_006740 [Pleurodeles waltl]